MTDLSGSAGQARGAIACHLWVIVQPPGRGTSIIYSFSV
jgi:hypothetical protein